MGTEKQQPGDDPRNQSGVLVPVYQSGPATAWAVRGWDKKGQQTNGKARVSQATCVLIYSVQFLPIDMASYSEVLSTHSICP
jgi:hypothetical protein